MEFADGGDLLKKIETIKKTRNMMKETEIWGIIIQLISGLKALHDLKICHRDLKVSFNKCLFLPKTGTQCANVFMTKAGVAKLGDLNVSKVVKAGLLKTQTGTPYYASPEIWSDKPYSYKSDIWSLGAVIYELTVTKPPFMANDMKSLADKVKKGVYPAIPHQYSSDLA